MRTSVASINTAAAKPSPNTFSSRLSPSMNAENTQTMISAAAVITLAVTASPSATAAALLPVRSNSSFMRDSKNTS